MLGLQAIDFVRGFICLLLIEGFFYFFFPKVIQSFILTFMADATIRMMKQFGLLLLSVGLVLAYLFRNG